MDLSPEALTPPSAPASALLYRDRLRARFGARLCSIRLFGSHARGEAREESDVDLLALVEGLTHREKIEAIELGAEISLETGAWLSPLVMDTHAFEELERLEARLALDILREGMLL